MAEARNLDTSFRGGMMANESFGLGLDNLSLEERRKKKKQGEGHEAMRRRGSLRLSTSDSEVLTQLEDDIVQEALRSGMDLREYSKKVEEELRKVEHEAVQDYIKEADEISSLHTEISTCDNVLQRMEEMLATFQADLGSISSEIQSLQEQSVEMNVKLKNRQGVRGELSQFVDDMVIPETMIRVIFDIPVTERIFLEQLHELQHKITFMKQQEFREAKACADVHDVVENLRMKAVEKIREYLLTKIHQFKKPLANYQIPQNAMLKFRFFYEFLLANERHIAKEIRDDYVDTMSKMFFSYFKTYGNRLMRLNMDDQATKEDLLGADDSVKAVGLFSTRTVKNRAAVFSLGTRASVVGPDLEATIIVPHAAQLTNQKFNFEALFRSLQYALVDHASHEYLFITDFFMTSGQTAMDLFNQVLGKAISSVTSLTDDYAHGSHDAISLFLCITICYRYQALMQKRGVHALDQYWERLLGVMWPRFELIMRQHAESLKIAEPAKLGTIDTRPHYIVRRYAEFASALIGVSQAGPNVERLHGIMTRLQAEVEQFLAKLASEVPGGRKEHFICLINNYDLIQSVLTERGLEETREATMVKEILANQIEAYVEELLFPHFGALMNFVKECEPLMDQGHTELLKRYTDKVPNIVRSFGAQWKRAIEHVNQEVMRSFTNFKNGTNILQTALTQLIQYYHRFSKLLGQQAFANCAAKNELVNIHHIMVEVKKYKPVF